jgi:hypothetical protein
VWLAADLLEEFHGLCVLDGILSGDKYIKSILPAYPPSRQYIVRHRNQLHPEIMAARQHDDQVDIGGISFAGDEAPIHDDGNDQVGRTNLLAERLQFFVEAKAEIRRLKGSKAFANFLQRTIVDAGRQESLLIEIGNGHLNVPVFRMS